MRTRIKKPTSQPWGCHFQTNLSFNSKEGLSEFLSGSSGISAGFLDHRSELVLQVQSLLFLLIKDGILGILDTFFHPENLFVQLLIFVHELAEMSILQFQLMNCVVVLGKFGSERMMINRHALRKSFLRLLVQQQIERRNAFAQRLRINCAWIAEKPIEAGFLPSLAGSENGRMILEAAGLG